MVNNSKRQKTKQKMNKQEFSFSSNNERTTLITYKHMDPLEFSC